MKAGVPILVTSAALLAGCSAPRLDDRMTEAVAAGRYGVARERLEQAVTETPMLVPDREAILDRSRLLLLTLADGSPDAAEEVSNQTFSLLRTQGLNADRTIRSTVFYEGVRIWKGEPFEQAMLYSYVAIQKAQRGEWDNARAAAQSSLFLLKDFSDNEKKVMSTSELVKKASEVEQRRGSSSAEEYLDNGYAAVKTNFTLGYLLAGVASKAIGRDDEASDFLREAANVDPSLAELTDLLRAGRYNTVVVVDEGKGPTKIATGPDGAIAAFVSGSRAGNTLATWTAGGDSQRFPRALDVGDLARDHRWNNLEDVRRAKSLIGNALLVGGGAVAISAKDDEAKLAGVGAAIAGLLLKAGSGADTRHNEFMPQGVYMAALSIEKPETTLGLQIDNRPATRMMLPAINPPPREQKMQLLYVRIPPNPPSWAASGVVVHANDALEARVPGDDLPYIMGGRCVRTPSPATLKRYQQSGNLLDMTAVELANLYREEGITFEVEEQRGQSRTHILEGGTSLVCPKAGSTGYLRLFCQPHKPYQPRSAALKQAIEGLRISSSR
jgi:tetratricopeptide (TPR) repeat protein